MLIYVLNNALNKKNITCEKIQSEYKLKLINSEANSKIGEGGE